MGFGTVFMVFIALAIAYAVFASYLRREYKTSEVTTILPGRSGPIPRRPRTCWRRSRRT
jgi:hypothetical protein